MGCLKKIITIVVIVMAFIGFKSLGGWDIVQKKYDETINPSPEKIKAAATKIADFSSVPKEYKLERTANILGNKAVIAKDVATDQRMVVVEPTSQIQISQKDISSGNVDKKIEDIMDKFKYQPIRSENFKVTNKGTMTTMGQKVPYITFTTSIVGAKVKSAEGLISVANDEKGKEKILISLNFNGKYSQVIAEDFFNSIK